MLSVIGFIFLILASFGMGNARANDLIDMRADLARMSVASTEKCPATKIQDKALDQLTADWELVSAAATHVDNVKFTVSDCDSFAFASTANEQNTVVLSKHVAAFPAEVRYFIIAHELGHLRNNDWDTIHKVVFDFSSSGIIASSQMSTFMALFKKASHQFEFAADKYAAQVLQNMGISPKYALETLFFKVGDQPDSVTHPSSSVRLSKLVN